jgi:hypothetical protein
MTPALVKVSVFLSYPHPDDVYLLFLTKTGMIIGLHPTDQRSIVRQPLLYADLRTKKAALKGQLLCCFHFGSENQPSEIAPTGQVPAQDPQSMQASASMLYWVSP